MGQRLPMSPRSPSSPAVRTAVYGRYAHLHLTGPARSGNASVIVVPGSPIDSAVSADQSPALTVLACFTTQANAVPVSARSAAVLCTILHCQQ